MILPSPTSTSGWDGVVKLILLDELLCSSLCLHCVLVDGGFLLEQKKA
jgi:hypothetical protein